MQRDVKEIVGVLMRVLGGGRVSRDEVTELSFEADGELLAALNEAYIRLSEFSYDCEDRADNKARDALQVCLDKIIAACDRLPGNCGEADELRGSRAVKPGQEPTLQRVRRVLMQQWDPIGVRDVPQAQDEYDIYAEEIVRMLSAGRSARELVAYLMDAETNAMGLRGNQERACIVAAALCKIIDG